MRYACQEEDACDQSCFGVALAGFLEYCFSGQSRGAPPHQRGSDASRRTAGGRGGPPGVADRVRVCRRFGFIFSRCVNILKMQVLPTSAALDYMKCRLPKKPN